jgi:cell fate (sporulation/competence/biofilm development) regulator YlbF (YheA/YmcA/DUF963 family)
MIGDKTDYPECMPSTKRTSKFEIEAGRSYTLKEFTAIKKQAKEARVKGLDRRPETELLMAMKLRVIKAALETDDVVYLLEAEQSLLGQIMGKNAAREDKAYWEWRQTYRGNMPRKPTAGNRAGRP